jgi:hypothetical protein
MATRRSDESMEGARQAAAGAGVGGRRAELDDWLNGRIYHPLAHRLARLLAHTPISPNLVSVAGGLTVLAAGALYTGLSWPLSVALGFLVHVSWHILDGADGDLARLTGRASPVGELVDGLCDYISHALLYVMLGAFLDGWIGIWAWIVGWIAGLSRVAQANHAESQRRTYLWRAYGVPWLKQTREAEPAARRSALLRAFSPIAEAYVRLGSLASPCERQIDGLVAQGSRTPAALERTRRVCKDEGRLPLRLQTLLGANWRTIALGASMAAGSPLWFFLLEATLLNLLLVVSVMVQRRCDRRIVARLEANAAILG